jgi:hypothetical protein
MPYKMIAGPLSIKAGDDHIRAFICTGAIMTGVIYTGVIARL